jgi:hypothetical protein
MGWPRERAPTRREQDDIERALRCPTGQRRLTAVDDHPEHDPRGPGTQVTSARDPDLHLTSGAARRPGPRMPEISPIARQIFA